MPAGLLRLADGRRRSGHVGHPAPEGRVVIVSRLADRAASKPLESLFVVGGVGEDGAVPVPRVAVPQLIPVLERIGVKRRGGGRPRTRSEHLSGDKAYSSRRNRATCAGAGSSTPFRSRGTSGPTADAAAAKEAGPSASARRGTSAATKASARSTGSSVSGPWRRGSTSVSTSSTALSPSPRSGSGSAHDRQGGGCRHTVSIAPWRDVLLSSTTTEAARSSNGR